MVMIKHEVNPIFPHTLPKPNCPDCGFNGPNLVQKVTRRSNRNGNAGRLYIRCEPCGRFLTFLDTRGTHQVNPECLCSKASRIQVANQNKGRGLHYVCSTGGCDFYDIAPDDDGKQVKLLDEGLLKKLAHLRLI